MKTATERYDQWVEKKLRSRQRNNYVRLLNKWVHVCFILPKHLEWCHMETTFFQHLHSLCLYLNQCKQEQCKHRKDCLYVTSLQKFEEQGMCLWLNRLFTPQNFPHLWEAFNSLMLSRFQPQTVVGLLVGRSFWVGRTYWFSTTKKVTVDGGQVIAPSILIESAASHVVHNIMFIIDAKCILM